MSFLRCRLARTLCVALLVPALLLATAAGARHRIAHASSAAATAGDEVQTHGPAAHSCAAYDAHTLAERLGSAVAPLPLSIQRPPAGASAAFASALLPFVAHFSPRAPPASCAPSACRPEGAAPSSSRTNT